MQALDDISLPTYALCRKYVDKQVGGGGAITGTIGSIVLGTNWTLAADGSYTQSVTATGYTVTTHTLVNLIADATTIAQMIADRTTQIYISNNNATLTAVAFGNPPTVSMTVQAEFSEVNN